MPSKQIWLTRTVRIEEVIAEARQTFPDAETDAHALARALFHWQHDRKRGSLSRLEEGQEKILEYLTILLELANTEYANMEFVRVKLTEDDNGTDHA